MTSYVAVSNGEIDADSPITADLMSKLRDNPIAIAEGASTVPSNLFPTVLLGTLTTSSGTTQTLSGLDLTPYKFLYISVKNVTFSGTSSLGLSGGSVQISNVTSGTPLVVAVTVDLISGVVGNTDVSAGVWTGSTASTSLVFYVGGGIDTFTGGSIYVYGVK